mgnify:FL=1
MIFQVVRFFYDFPRIEDAKEWKTNYREVLDTLPLDDAKKDALIEEANYAFRLNMYLFDEVEGSATKSLWKILLGFIKGGN